MLVRGTGSSKAWLLALLDRPEVRAGEAGGVPARLLAAGARLVPPHPEAAVLAAAVEAYG